MAPDRGALAAVGRTPQTGERDCAGVFRGLVCSHGKARLLYNTNQLDADLISQPASRRIADTSMARRSNAAAGVLPAISTYKSIPMASLSLSRASSRLLPSLPSLLLQSLLLLGLCLLQSPSFAADVLPDTIAQRVAACTACHGKEGRASSDGFYPRIAGKPEGYLFNQLTNFRDGHRQYPLMTYLLDHLSDDYLREIAAYFSQQHPPYPPPQPAAADPVVLERGRVLVMQGDAGKQVPACIACHGQGLTGVAPAIPGLLGLPRDYINAQFGAWKNGVRKAKSPDCMALVTARLSLEDINAASSWLAAQTVPQDARPAAAPTTRLPLSCGSVAATGEPR